MNRKGFLVVNCSKVFTGVQDCDNNEDEIIDCPVSEIPTPEKHDHLTGNEMGILNYRLYNEINWTLPDWYDAYTLSEYEDLHDLFDFTLMSRELVDKIGKSMEFEKEKTE